LNASIKILEETPEMIILGSELHYAVYVEYGRGPVVPINAKFLHFVTKDGKEVFTKYVGPAEPRPFLEPAVISASIGFEDVYVQKMEEKIKSLSI
jgi:hypothetical protein